MQREKRRRATPTIAWALAISLVLAAPATFGVRAAEEDRADKENGVDHYVEVNVSELPTSNTIVAKLPVPLMLTPANVGTVAAPLLEEQGALVLGDALTNVSGVNVQEQNGVHDYFLIRGFDSINGSLILTDGAAEPEATYYPTYNIAGVEVLKGPGGFLYGRNPLAGAVNIVRKQPVALEQLSIGVAGGSFGFLQSTVDWNTANSDGDLAFRLNGMWTESDNYRNDKNSDHFAINPSFVWKVSDRSTLTVNLEYLDAEYSPDSGISVLDPFTTGAGYELADVPRRRSYQPEFDFSDQQVTRFQVDFETRLNDHVRLRNKTYYRRLDWQSQGTLLTGTVPLGPGATLALRSFSTLEDDQEFIGNQFEAIFAADTGSVKHDLLIGLEVARETDDFALGFLAPEGTPGFEMLPTVPGILLENPVETFTEPVFVLPLVNGDAESDIIAPYLIDQITFSDKWRVQVGARWDNVDFREPVSGISRDDDEVSPMAGVVFSPDDSLSIYANGSEAFAPPVSRITPNPEDMADPEDFIPEQARQIELGVKKNFRGGKLRTVFSVYDIERENIGIPDPNGTTLQTGDQAAQGLEVELAAEPAPRTRLFFSYAYNDAELTSFSERIQIPDPMNSMMLIGATVDYSGNRPAFAPEHLGRFWLSRGLSRGFTVGGGARFIGKQFIDENNGFEIDSAVVVDAMVGYDVGEWRIKAHFRNITDEEYETRGFGSFSVIPADAFSATLSFEYRMR